MVPVRAAANFAMPEPGGEAHDPSARRKVVVAPPVWGTTPAVAAPNWGTATVGLPATPSPLVTETGAVPAIERVAWVPAPVRTSMPVVARPARAVRSVSMGWYPDRLATVAITPVFTTTESAATVRLVSPATTFNVASA